MASSEVKEVDSARDRLSGALTLAADKFGGEETGNHGLFGSPLKRLQSLDSPLGSPSKSPRVVRRRRKKEGPIDSAFHHTFVMKLFDRSVDLAQFPEGTSLYPVCRAWMVNQPRNTSMAPRLRTPTPEPETKEDEDEKEHKEGVKEVKEGEKNGVDVIESEPEPPSKKSKPDDAVYQLPSHQPLDVNAQGEEVSLRVPEPSLHEVDHDTLNSLYEPSSDGKDRTVSFRSSQGLLSDHMVRWSRVRKSWRNAAAKNECRYRESTELLRTMFER